MISKEDGTNSIIVCPGASMEITKDEVDKYSSLITSCKVFLTQLEIKTKVTLHALKLAKKGNAITILNPAPAVEIEDEFFKYIDFFTPNETEAQFYFGKKIESYEEAKLAGDFFLNKGVKNSIITLGEKGAYFSNASLNFSVPALNLKGKVIDTTGAGDAFNGGLAYGLSKKKQIRECLELANKVAGISTTKLGAGNSMPFIQNL